jgi:hypothetical protein
VYQLLADMPAERFTALYTALPSDVSRALDGAIARMLNCRVPSVRRQPEALRAKALRAFILRERDDDVSADLLRAYFLGARKPLVTQFLDATGVAHEDGQVGEEDAEPDAARVPDAVKALLADHDPRDVRLYLQVAALQWPEHTGLADALEAVPASG